MVRAAIVGMGTWGQNLVIRHAKGKKGVWFATHAEVAEFALKNSG